MISRYPEYCMTLCWFEQVDANMHIGFFEWMLLREEKGEGYVIFIFAGGRVVWLFFREKGRDIFAPNLYLILTFFLQN